MARPALTLLAVLLIVAPEAGAQACLPFGCAEPTPTPSPPAAPTAAPVAPARGEIRLAVQPRELVHRSTRHPTALVMGALTSPAPVGGRKIVVTGVADARDAILFRRSVRTDAEGRFRVRVLPRVNASLRAWVAAGQALSASSPAREVVVRPKVTFRYERGVRHARVQVAWAGPRSDSVLIPMVGPARRAHLYLRRRGARGFRRVDTRGFDEGFSCALSCFRQALFRVPYGQLRDVGRVAVCARQTVWLGMDGPTPGCGKPTVRF